VPRSGHYYEIEILAAYQFFEGMVAIRIQLRRLLPGLRHQFLRMARLILYDIEQRISLSIRRQQIPKQRRTRPPTPMGCRYADSSPEPER
jgi:hypothetical protein